MPTALELGPEGWKRYIKVVKSRVPVSGNKRRESAERDRILLRVREVATTLKNSFGAKRVFLFGSLAHDAWFVTDSDVDLAVEGLKCEDYWEAWRIAEEIINDRSVDLIDIETAGDSMKNAIHRYGVEL